jgi:hypothetical protein
MNNMPTRKPAVIYNQDELSDYAKLGGSLASLFADEIRDGNCIVITQEAINSPNQVVSIIETEEDLRRRLDAAQKMEEWLRQALGGDVNPRACGSGPVSPPVSTAPARRA